MKDIKVLIGEFCGELAKHPDVLHLDEWFQENGSPIAEGWWAITGGGRARRTWRILQRFHGLTDEQMEEMARYEKGGVK